MARETQLQAADAGAQLRVHDDLHQLGAREAAHLQAAHAVLDADLPALVDVGVHVRRRRGGEDPRVDAE